MTKSLFLLPMTTPLTPLLDFFPNIIPSLKNFQIIRPLQLLLLLSITTQVHSALHFPSSVPPCHLQHSLSCHLLLFPFTAALFSPLFPQTIDL